MRGTVCAHLRAAMNVQHSNNIGPEGALKLAGVLEKLKDVRRLKLVSGMATPAIYVENSAFTLSGASVGTEWRKGISGGHSNRFVRSTTTTLDRWGVLPWSRRWDS